MGDIMMGSAKHSGNAPLMTGEQNDYLSQLLQGLGPEAQGALSQFLQPYDSGQYQDLFQQAFIDPAMQTYEQQVLPGIQQRFVDANAGSSSALNQALGQSAADLSTMLGGQMGQFFQQQQGNTLSALGLGNQALGQRSFDPIIQQRQGLAGPLIGAGGQAAGLAAASSREIKENIKDYAGGLDLINQMEVKQYDYKDPYDYKGKDKVGLIAEDVPPVVQEDIDGLLHVDLYGLLAISINAIKELSAKVEALEAK